MRLLRLLGLAIMLLAALPADASAWGWGWGRCGGWPCHGPVCCDGPMYGTHPAPANYPWAVPAWRWWGWGAAHSGMMTVSPPEVLPHPRPVEATTPEPAGPSLK
jgi:hypothetical protein